MVATNFERSRQIKYGVQIQLYDFSLHISFVFWNIFHKLFFLALESLPTINLWYSETRYLVASMFFTESVAMFCKYFNTKN